MYCISNKIVNIANETNYKISWVEKKKLPNYHIIYETIDANIVNKIKLLKRGLRSFVKSSLISFNEKKQNLALINIQILKRRLGYFMTLKLN